MILSVGYRVNSRNAEETLPPSGFDGSASECRAVDNYVCCDIFPRNTGFFVVPYRAFQRLACLLSILLWSEISPTFFNDPMVKFPTNTIIEASGLLVYNIISEKFSPTGLSM